MTDTSKRKFQPVIVPIFDWWVFVVVGEIALAELCEEWAFSIGEEDTHGTKAFCMPMEFDSGELKGKQFNVLYFDDRHFNAGVIVHEVTHSIHFMMKSRGIPVKMSNTEVMAYSTEYLFNEVVEKIKEQ